MGYGTQTFVRNATGLVRSISFFDALFSNLAIINIASALTFPVILIAFSFPNANIPLAVLITLPLVLLYNLLYSTFSRIMPRSGGDYIFISRGLNPLLGFAANFSFAMWNTFWIGVYASWVSTIGLSSLFYALGVTEGSSSLQQLGATFASPTMGFIIGTVIVLLITILSAVGTKRVINLQNVLVSVGILGILVVLGVPLSYNKATFASAVSKYVSYNAVISAGGAAPSQFALDQTVLATGLVALTMLFGQFSVYVGGEIRTPEKSIPKAIVITTLVTTVALLIGGYIVHNVFGIEFTASLYSLWNTPAYPFQTGGYQVGPYFNLLVSLLTNNPILIILIGLSFTFWTMSSAIFNLIANSRCVLSWSFDRVFPAKMATVNERFHTPVYAILLNAIIAEGLLYLFSFNVSVVSFMAGTTLGYVFTFGSAAIAGITFPLLKRSKSIYEGSPFRREFLGIPVISLFGFGTLVYLAILSYGLLTNAIFGVNSPLSLLGIAAFWILGGIIGAMFYAYRKRQGLEISKVFAMIPPE